MNAIKLRRLFRLPARHADHRDRVTMFVARWAGLAFAVALGVMLAVLGLNRSAMHQFVQLTVVFKRQTDYIWSMEWATPAFVEKLPIIFTVSGVVLVVGLVLGILRVKPDATPYRGIIGERITLDGKNTVSRTFTATSATREAPMRIFLGSPAH